MNILKKLATPFIVVGRWIKETAWVQPLLIVGVIFAIIFSIPSITSGIQGLIDSQSDDMNWYKNFQISLDGTYDKTSDANDFFADFVSQNIYCFAFVRHISEIIAISFFHLRHNQLAQDSVQKVNYSHKDQHQQHRFRNGKMVNIAAPINGNHAVFV